MVYLPTGLTDAGMDLRGTVREFTRKDIGIRKKGETRMWYGYRYIEEKEVRGKDEIAGGR